MSGIEQYTSGPCVCAGLFWAEDWLLGWSLCPAPCRSLGGTASTPTATEIAFSDVAGYPIRVTLH